MREVVDPALTQVLHGGADLLQRDARVEQSLDDLQDQDVAEAVQALGARAAGAADARLDESGACPVVELAVGDAGGGADGRTAVADVLGECAHLVGEEQSLLACALARRLFAACRCATSVPSLGSGSATSHS